MYPSPHIVDKENKTIRIHFRLRNKSWEGSFPWERCSFLLMLFAVLKEEIEDKRFRVIPMTHIDMKSRNIYVTEEKVLNLKQKVLRSRKKD